MFHCAVVIYRKGEIGKKSFTVMATQYFFKISIQLAFSFIPLNCQGF